MKIRMNVMDSIFTASMNSAMTAYRTAKNAAPMRSNMNIAKHISAVFTIKLMTKLLTVSETKVFPDVRLKPYFPSIFMVTQYS